MKKLLFILLLSLTTVANSQVWFDMGLKGGVGAGFILNKTLNDDGRFGVLPGVNYFIGGKVGVNFAEVLGVALDVDYGSYKFGFTQAEVPGKSNTEGFNYKIGYKAINFMPAFRYTKEASYLEIGPTFSIVKKPFIEDAAYPNSSPVATDYISAKLTGITFGFGGHMIGNEFISLMMGLRMNYVFSNLTADAWESSNFPFSNYPTITTSAKTSPINAQLVMEINYSLGYFVKASCGRRAFLTF